MGNEIINRGGTGAPHCGNNPPTGLHDLHVTLPLDAHFKFSSTITRPNGVRVWID